MSFESLQNWPRIGTLPQEIIGKIFIAPLSWKRLLALQCTAYLHACIAGNARDADIKPGLSPYFADGNLSRFGLGSKVSNITYVLLCTAGCCQMLGVHTSLSKSWQFQKAAWTFGQDVLVITKPKLSHLDPTQRSVLEMRCNKVHGALPLACHAQNRDQHSSQYMCSQVVSQVDKVC